MADINVTIEDAQPISVTVENAQPINVSLGEAVNNYLLPGPKGDTGEQGPQGIAGPQGDPATNLVQSVNGKQRVVVLNATDVGADPTGSSAQALQDAKGYTDNEVSTLDSSLATVAKTGSYNDLSNKPTIPSIAGLATEQYVNNAVAPKANTSDLGTAAFEDVEDLPVSTAQQTALNAKANASDTVNLTGGQTVAGVKTFSSSPIVPTATTDTQAVNKAQMDAADALKLNISDPRTPLQGTGFPNGVVSASVGSTYIDTAATSGAIEWKKATGTGNTGWVVSVGDTGWRNIGTISGITEPIKVRRVGQNVYFSQIGDSITVNAIVTLSRLTLPIGFRSSVRQQSDLNTTTGVTRGVLLVKSTEADLILSTQSTGTYVALSNGAFVTSQDWPSTLPGTAI